jgi:hypothetical protein
MDRPFDDAQNLGDAGGAQVADGVLPGPEDAWSDLDDDVGRRPPRLERIDPAARVRRRSVGYQSPAVKGHFSTLVIGCCSGLALFCLWFLLAGTTERWQTVVGAACAAVATTGGLLVARMGAVSVRPRAVWLLRSLAAPWWVVRDTAIVLRAIAGLIVDPAPRGRFRSFRFPYPGKNGQGASEPSARGIAGRALVESVGSAGPNSLVLGPDDERPVVLLHELVGQSAPPGAVTLLEER